MLKQPLRFAPLVRVSTESQARKGESLAIQRDFIEKTVAQLGGIIPEGLWQRYSGQEHATVGQERKKLENLLRDAAVNVFDAVIVADASRWSRDNLKSKAGLEILRQNNIRFFLGGTEIDLRSPQDRMFLGLSTEINEFFGAEQARKSLESRITRAKQGIPVSGKLPYARTFDKVKGWGLDETKAEQIRWAAREYLAGGRMKGIAKALGANTANLWKTLCFRCGDQWEQSFTSAQFDRSEVIPCKVPRILDDETIAAIRSRGSHNRTFCRGVKVNKYLLSGYIRCTTCGYVLQGQTNRQRSRYYRHPSEGSRKETCGVKAWIRADEIEKAVLAHLFALHGNPVGMERAVENMFPRLEEIQTTRDLITAKKNELTGVQKELDALVIYLTRNVLTEDEYTRRADVLRKQKQSLDDVIAELSPRVAGMPTQKTLRSQAGMAQRILASTFDGLAGLKSMRWEDARKLIQRLFTGQDITGRALGIWVTWDSQSGIFSYEIVAGLGKICVGALPMSLAERRELLEIEDEFFPSDYDPTSSVVDFTSYSPRRGLPSHPTRAGSPPRPA